MTIFRTVENLTGDIYEHCTKPEKLGLCPKVFYTVRNDIIQKIGTDAALLASRTSGGLDSLAIAEEMSLSYELGDRTLFGSVKRLLPWERMVSRNGELAIENVGVGDPPSCILEFLSDQVATAFGEGVALELTGGLDSRLLLAAGLRRGTKPKLSFTIGEANSLDVMTASAIAARFHFPHVSLPLVVDPDRIKQDMLDFVRASGYAVNAACYAWIPATLAVLDDKRSAQMSGLVGELAGSFYYTPFDSLIEPLNLQKLWVRYRMMRPSMAWQRIWRSDLVEHLEAELIQEVLKSVNRASGTWRERIDLYYKNERIRRWALPVLDASNTYYTVVAPLLSSEYCAWSSSLPVARRPKRTPQRELLARAHPELAEFKISERVPDVNSMVALSTKVVRRLRRTNRPSSLGVLQSAIALAQDSDIREYISAMAHESNIGLLPAPIEHLMDHPEESPELLGTVITAAVAWHDMKHHKNSMCSNADRLDMN